MLMKVSKLTVDFYGQFKAALSGLRRTEPSGQEQEEDKDVLEHEGPLTKNIGAVDVEDKNRS